MKYNYQQIYKELGLNKKDLVADDFNNNITRLYDELFYDDSKIIKSVKKMIFSYEKRNKKNTYFIITDKGINKVALADVYTYNVPAHKYFLLIKRMKALLRFNLDEYSLIRMSPRTTNDDLFLYYNSYKKERYVSNHSGINDSGRLKFEPIFSAIYLSNLRYCFFYVPGGSLLDVEDEKVRFVLLLTVFLLLDEYGFVPTN